MRRCGGKPDEIFLLQEAMGDIDVRDVNVVMEVILLGAVSRNIVAPDLDIAHIELVTLC